MRLTIQVEVIVFRENCGLEFLLLKRNKNRGDFWQPVTGGIEEGETPEEAVFRELFEETQLKKEDVVKILDKIHSFSFISDGRKIEELVFGIKIKPDSKIILSEEHTERKWVGLEEALSLLKWETNKEAFINLNKILTGTSN